MIKSFRSKNFCQHTDFNCEFHPRMTAILGPNGSGKSNILAGIIGALANEWINTGNKDANISDGTAGTAFVEVEVEHNEDKFSVLRGRSGTKSRLVRPREEDLLGESEVTQAVLETLGITKRMLMDYVLVRQGSISGILSSPLAERGKAFQQLFGTGRCEEIYQAAAPVIQSLSATIDLSHMDDLKSRLADLLTQCAGVHSRLNEISLGMPSDAILLEGRSACLEGEKWNELCEKHHALSERLDKVTTSGAQAANDLAGVTEMLGSVNELYAESEKDAEEGRVQLRLAGAYAVAAEKRKEQNEKIEVLNDKLRRLATRDEAILATPDGERPDYDILYGLNAQIETCDTLLSGMDPNAGPRDDCPMCGTEDVDLSQIAFVLEDRRAAAEKSRKAVEDTIAIWDMYDNRKDEADAAEQELHNLEDSVRTEIDALRDALIDPPEPVDEADWTEKVQAFDSAKSDREMLNKSVSEIQVRIETAYGIKKEIREELDAVGREWKDVKQLSDEKKLTIQQMAEKAVELKEEQATEQGRLSALVAHISDVDEDIAGLEKQRKANERSLAMAKKLENVRGAFHRNGIPAEVSRAYLKTLVNGQRGGVGINDLLASFSSTFRAEVREEDLSFWAHFDDGKVQPAERLSGGEKVVLALALRTAVNSMFASSLSMLFLDEPTEYLDEANLDCLQTAMSRLGELADQKGLQVIVITHEQGLAHLFDHTIKL